MTGTYSPRIKLKFIGLSIISFFSGTTLPVASQDIQHALSEGDQLVRVFSGYDAGNPIGYHVFEESVIRHSSILVSVTALQLSMLQRLFTRPKVPGQLTDFTYSRFITLY